MTTRLAEKFYVAPCDESGPATSLAASAASAETLAAKGPAGELRLARRGPERRPEKRAAPLSSP